MKTITRNLVTAMMAVCCTVPVAAQSLIPYPANIRMQEKHYTPKGKTLILADESLKNEQQYLLEHIGADLGRISLSVDESLSGNTEHYVLDVSRKGINIRGKSSEAVFDGIQTLLQLVYSEAKNAGGVCLPCLAIDDEPEYGYRALLLDPVRHFVGIEDVKRYIDEMAHYKFNVLQLHLTDDQGVRVEIKSHPELTAGIPHYSQQELKELIAYAAERHIEIVPEVDVPGHTFGILRSHPELLCDNQDTTGWGKNLRTDVMLCASKTGTYTLVSDILKEVCALFPSKRIHLGGDESVIPKNWGQCKACQELCRNKNLTANHLMGRFFDGFFTQLREAGKQPILWCEMDNIYYPANEYLFPYPKDVILVTWRNSLTPKAIELTDESGNPLIMAPGEHCYFDYPQGVNDLPEFNNWGMPMLSLRNAYEWDASGKMGVMGTLWSEAIPDINRAFYMTYPRALALAEVGWTPQSKRSFESFTKRMPLILMGMIERGISYRVPWEEYKAK